MGAYTTGESRYTREQRPTAPAATRPRASGRVETSGAKLGYLYLDVAGEATIDELQAAIGMKKVTLYSLLQTLTATELVDRVGIEYACQERTSDGGES